MVAMEVTNNTGGETYITSDDFSVIDGQGFQGSTYAADDIGKNVASGPKIKLNFAYCVDNGGPYQIKYAGATWK
jgi:hypothetical protein